METLKQMAAAWLVNVVWQPVVLWGAAALLLKLAPALGARRRFVVWMGVLGLVTVAPFGFLLDVTQAAPAGAGAWQAERWTGAGAAVAGLILLVGWVRLGRRMLAARSLAEFAEEAELSEELRAWVPAGVRVCVSPERAEALGPLTVGVRRAVILLPAALLRPGREGLLRGALAHEVGHLERRDPLWLVVAEFALAPLWFHPVGRLLAKAVGEARELACDEEVLARYLEPAEYGRSLLGVAAEMVARREAVCALGVLDGGILGERLRSIAAFEPLVEARRWVAGLGLGLVLAGLLAVSPAGLPLAVLQPGLGTQGWSAGLFQPWAERMVPPPPPPVGKVVRGRAASGVLPPPPPPPPPPPGA